MPVSISVVVPTYNRAALLPATIDALLAQTLPASEIIVVDDGSQDATPQVVDRYGPYVSYLRIDNSGELVARNTGVGMAKGDLIAFCDSDDLWRPGFLDAMAELWRLEPRTRVAYADFVVFRGGRWEEASKFAGTPAGFWDDLRMVSSDIGLFDRPVVDRLIRYQPFFPSCMVVERKSFVAIGGWDERVNRMVGMDFATTLRVAEHTPFGVVRRPLVGIRKHDGGFSADVQAMNLGDSRVLELVLAERPSLAPYADVIRRSIAERRLAAFNTAFARGDFKAVRDIDTLLPERERSASTRAKRLVATLPAPLRRVAAGALLAVGTACARLTAPHPSAKRRAPLAP